jgi:hypothetical protein
VTAHYGPDAATSFMLNGEYLQFSYVRYLDRIRGLSSQDTQLLIKDPSAPAELIDYCKRFFQPYVRPVPQMSTFRRRANPIRAIQWRAGIHHPAIVRFYRNDLAKLENDLIVREGDYIIENPETGIYSVSSKELFEEQFELIYSSLDSTRSAG